MNPLEEKIKEWRDLYASTGSMRKEDIDELEDHLREEIHDLNSKGLTEEEAFIIAAKRLGKLPLLSKEFTKVNTHNLWKTLISEPEDAGERAASVRELFLVIGLMVAAVFLSELPKLFGFTFQNNPLFYLKNLSFYVLPLVAIFFYIKKGSSPGTLALVLFVFGLSLIFINIYPYKEPFHTGVLTVLHLPLFLWFLCGIVYTAHDWRGSSGWMDFLRFTGELFIYTTLLVCGVMVVTGLIILLFEAIDIRAESFAVEHFLVPVAISMPIIGSYLVEEKKSVVENLAPILARIFAPVLLIIMLIFLASMVILQKSPFMERDFLIGFDLMLVLVLGIVFYILSTREENQTPQFYDWISLALITVALAVDIVALFAIIFRLNAFGISPNKTAALGENILIFIHLLGTGILFIQFFRGKVTFSRIEKWQTDFLPVFAVWLGIVALLFPILFGFN